MLNSFNYGPYQPLHFGDSAQMDKQRCIRFVLKIFPSRWRREYELELSSLLEREPLTGAVFCDVLRAGFVQQIRGCPVWVKGSCLLACWFIVGLATNSIRPLSATAYSLFWDTPLLFEVLLGYWLVKTGSHSPGRNTAYAALGACVPMVAIEALRKLHVVNPTILDLQGHVSQLGRGFNELAYRGDAGRADLYPFVVVMILAAISAYILGWLGGQIASAVTMFESAVGRK